MFKNHLIFALLFGLLSTASCQNKPLNITGSDTSANKELAISKPDSLQLNAFIVKHPDLEEFEEDLRSQYKKEDYKYFWFDEKGLREIAHAVYNRLNQIGEDGVVAQVPYKHELDSLFSSKNSIPQPNADFLISSAFHFYTRCVYEGVDTEKSMATGWLIPREKNIYSSYLDSLVKDPSVLDKEKKFSQYYNLKKALQKYRAIEKKGGWGTITPPSAGSTLNPGDSSVIISQIRTRLFTEGYLKQNTFKNVYDSDLAAAVLDYKTRHNRTAEATITPELINELNISITTRIRTLLANMERCRWLSPDLNNAKELIAVNIPSFRLHYIRDGKTILVSKVVVGKDVTKTVVFSGEMSYIAFSPYWNVPQSILEKEILPAIKKNPDYLAEHNMEWNGNKVRQKPGGKNSLGLVKFMFPNSNNIYLHDTPAKSLFNREQRAFSHGCIRVEKARELAIAITSKDENWTEQKVDAAMNAERETIYRLPKKIPVYIGYFTAWADDNGNVAFYPDIYERDEKLVELLYK